MRRQRLAPLQTISDDHYARTFYGTEPHTFSRHPHAGRSERTGGRDKGSCAARRDQDRPEKPKQVRGAKLGCCEPEKGAGRPLGLADWRHWGRRM
jgi:hypothetical protein